MAFRFSAIVAGFIILLSLLTFSGSVAPNTDAREPSSSEASVHKNTDRIRSISLKQGQQSLVSRQFFHTGTLFSIGRSLAHAERLLDISLLNHQKQETNPAEVLQAIHLHAPRSFTAVHLIG